MSSPPGHSGRHQECLQAFAAATPANAAVVERGLPMDSIKAARLCEATGSDRLAANAFWRIGLKNADVLMADQQRPAPSSAAGPHAEAGAAASQTMQAEAGAKNTMQNQPQRTAFNPKPSPFGES